MINYKFTSKQIYNGIICGANKIIENAAILNDINEFPVPDRDTGTNLSYLMKYVLRKFKFNEDYKTLMMSLSDCVIYGARGNSGSIFSQFLVGFGINAQKINQISINDLSISFNKGSEYAYKSVKNPVEGTILTVMRVFSESFYKNTSCESDLVNVLENSLENLKSEVKKTRYLSQDTKSKNEDAGAVAFQYFIEGFTEGVLTLDDIKPTEFSYNFEETLFEHVSSGEIKYRYCTEILVENYNKDKIIYLEKELTKNGDSLVISSNEKLMRIHIHTNSPEKIAKIMDDKGKIIEIKTDDMIMQNRLSTLNKGEIALVIDSIADIPEEFFSDFVYQIPMNILVDDVSYQDKRTVFKEVFENKRVTSSQLNKKQVENFLNPILNKYKHTFILTVSSKMSGLNERFNEAIIKFKDKATIIDTKLNSVAEGLVVYNAIKIIKDNYDIKKIKEEIESCINRTEIFVSVPKLDAMIKSGRLNDKIGWIMKKIGFLPLITINKEGIGKIKGIAFNKNKNEKIFYDVAINNKEDIENYALAHVYCHEKAKEVAEKLTKIIGRDPLYIEQVSSVVSNFSGEGSIAIGFIRKDKEGKK